MVPPKRGQGTEIVGRSVLQRLKMLKLLEAEVSGSWMARGHVIVAITWRGGTVAHPKQRFHVRLSGLASLCQDFDDALARLQAQLHDLECGGASFQQASSSTYASLLQTCSQLNALPEGKRVHAQIIRSGLERNVFLGNHIVNMFGKCRSIEDARRVFEKMPQKNVFSWTAMISAYAQQGDYKEAIGLLQRMEPEGVQPDKVTFVAALSSCACPASLAQGRSIHRLILGALNGFESDVVLGTALLTMYGKCGSLEDAHKVFAGIRDRNIVTWTSILAAYAQFGHPDDAFAIYRKMQLEGLKPTKMTFISVLNACSSSSELYMGKLIHDQVVESGFDRDDIVGNAVLNMHRKCGSLLESQEVFEKMPEKDMVTWTAMIAAYADNGQFEEALVQFQRMQLEGFKPDSITFVIALKACAKCRSLGIVERMFDTLDHLRDNVALWTVMISAHAERGQSAKALKLFQQSELEGLKPDKITLVTVLNVCANVAALEVGRIAHAGIIEQGLELDRVIGNALVDMYGKSGALVEARIMFEKMQSFRDVVSWNTMVAAYTRCGHGKQAVELFQHMQLEGMVPNDVTFLSILGACSHAGLVQEGFRFFASINGDYGAEPCAEHVGCMIDLCGRAGRLEEAEDCAESAIPLDGERSGVVTWTALLGACSSHGDLERVKRVAECVIDSGECCSSAYIALSNNIAVAGGSR